MSQLIVTFVNFPKLIFELVSIRIAAQKAKSFMFTPFINIDTKSSFVINHSTTPPFCIEFYARIWSALSESFGQAQVVGLDVD